MESTEKLYFSHGGKSIYETIAWFYIIYLNVIFHGNLSNCRKIFQKLTDFLFSIFTLIAVMDNIQTFETFYIFIHDV